MIGELGVTEVVDGGTWVSTRAGETGHAVYGPYVQTPPGRYRVTFQIALGEVAAPERDPLCAVVDVAAAAGQIILAAREVKASDLGASPRTFGLDITLWDPRLLEFRVAVTGAASLRVGGEPQFERLGGAPPRPASDPCEDTFDPVELHHKVRAVLRLLRPFGLRGLTKTRLGAAGDGGYVCVDDFRAGDTAFSFGINDDISWDLDAAERGLRILQFDHTVDDPAPSDPRMTFEKKMIAPVSGPQSQSLADLIRAHDRGEQRPNLVLKMDIEIHEWDVINATDPALLGRFSQIVCEFHYFQSLNRQDWRQKIHTALTRLNANYAVVHVHANAVGEASIIAGVFTPHVLEVTLANRALYDFEETDETFPGPLDVSCHPDRPDIWLGAFRY